MSLNSENKKKQENRKQTTPDVRSGKQLKDENHENKN